MKPEQIESLVEVALAPVKRELLHPEERNPHTGKFIPATPEWRRGAEAGRPIENPRDRLAIRLELLCAVKKWELKLVKEITDDTDAINDAKAHKEAGNVEH